jgi:TRAP-type C4-dicarboxylate transport system permease small subunit
MDVPEAPIVEQEAVYKKPKNIFDKTVVFSFSFITFTMSLVLTTLIVIATVLRYVLEVDLYGYEEWVKLFAFWLYFSGAALGAFNGTHVSADLVQSYIPNGKLKNFFVFLKDLVTVVVSGLFVWYGYEFFWFGFRGPLGTGVALPMTTAWRIPFWTSYLAVFIGLIFMFWYFARDLCKSTRKLLVGGNQ